MLRSLVSTARRQRIVALFSVIALALAVPPAFGAPSVASQVKTALKLAKRADKNATAAMKLAKTASTSGGTESAGATGPKGATGAAGAVGAAGVAGTAGPAGAKGDAGPAGPAGPAGSNTGTPGAKGDKGEKGDTGATGAQGIQGPPGTTPSGGGGGHGFVSHLASVQSVPLVDIADTPVTTISNPGAGSYLINVALGLRGSMGSDVVSCKLVSGGTTLVTATTPNIYQGTDQSLSLVGAGSVASQETITVTCRSSNPGVGNIEVTRADMTALAVGTLTTSP